jgi:hypothetical protein
MKSEIRCPKCGCSLTATLLWEKKAIQPPVIMRLYRGECPEHGEFSQRETVPYQT